MACLIDTDVMVDVSRRNANAADYVDSLADARIAIVTAQELIVGARDKRDDAGIDSLIVSYPVVHINGRIGARAYDLLKTYAKSHGLRTFDSLIAATALERGLTLVTRNRKQIAGSGVLDPILFPLRIVAHALLRAVSTLVSRPSSAPNKSRDESRLGTQECVRHDSSEPDQPDQQAPLQS